MSFGLLAATVLQTALISVFILVLTPFRTTIKKSLWVMGGCAAVLCIVVGLSVARYGSMLLYKYGFVTIGAAIFAGLYLLSGAKGVRFLFVVLTAVLLHQMLLTLLMTFRVWDGGFTPLYFLLNLLLFGALIFGGWTLRGDFHRIVFTFRAEFCCLCPILLLLFVLIRLFSPVVGQNQIDYDLLTLSLTLYLLIVLLYIYIGVNFHSLSRRCDAERDAVALRHEIATVQEHVALFRGFQESAAVSRHDLRHHLSLIGEFLDAGETEKLREYLVQAAQELENDTPKRYCQNEAANLLLASFHARACTEGVALRADARLPHSLSIGNTELCALLSNALENAITAAARTTGERGKNVRLTAELSGGKLLILVENPYEGEVRVEDGLPQSDKAGHGFGVKSIAAIVEKYNGLYSFDAANGLFTLRIVL